VRGRTRILGLTPCDRSLDREFRGFSGWSIASKYVLLTVEVEPLRNRGVEYRLCLASKG
jgi:hypothetical protein